MARGRFAVAIHALVLLAHSPGSTTSSFLAGSVNTHATCVRRVLVTLARAGLIEATEGREGGYRLARPASDITLAEIYHAVGDDPLLRPNAAAANPHCPISVAMGCAFAEIVEDAEKQFRDALSRRTLADVATKVVTPAMHPHLSDLIHP